MRPRLPPRGTGGGRGDLTDGQWQRLAPLLPTTNGRPRLDDRRVIDGILWVLRLWVLRTGAPWRDLPACYGKVSTVVSRFYRWRRAGVWVGMLAGLQRTADAAGRLDWSLHFVDSTVVRAHQHAAGAKGGS